MGRRSEVSVAAVLGPPLRQPSNAPNVRRRGRVGAGLVPARGERAGNFLASWGRNSRIRRPLNNEARAVREPPLLVRQHVRGD